MIQALTELGQINVTVDGLDAVTEEDYVTRVSPSSVPWSEVQAKMDELRPAEELKRLRKERDKLLRESDKYALPDYPHTRKEAWMTYRQALRDLPATGGEWPVKPE